MSNQTNLKIVNILGQEKNDPICDFPNCYHRFSLHGHRSYQAEFNCVQSSNNKNNCPVIKPVKSVLVMIMNFKNHYLVDQKCIKSCIGVFIVVMTES